MFTLQAIMVTYLGIMLIIGIVLSRKIKDVTDFLLAGRSLGVILCTATLAATHLGGGFILGSGEAGYLDGISGVWYGVSTGLGLLLLGFLFASKFRALKLTTVSDYLETRYGGKEIRILTAILSLVAIIGILAAQVKAAEGIMVMLGFNSQISSVVVTCIFIVYTAISGMWGVTVTDFIQVIIAGGGIVVASILSLVDLGGFTAIKANIDIPGYFNVSSIGFSSIIWILLPTVMYTLIGQDFLQRLFSSKNEKTARASGIFSGLLLILIAMAPVIAGMAAQVKFPYLDNPRAAIPTLVTEVFPPVVGGVVLAAIMAAVMSTADSLLCAGSSHLINDLYLRLGKNVKYKGKKLLNLTILSTVALGLVSLIVAMSIPSIITALIYAYTMFTAGVFVPVVMGLIWSRGTKVAALASMIVGSAIALLGVTNIISFGVIPVEIGASIVSFVTYLIATIFSDFILRKFDSNEKMV